MLKILMLILFLFISASCTTMPLQECTGDWYQKGKIDAYKAKPKSTYADHNDICRLNGMVANKKEYARGYVKGEDTFCSERGGIVYGSTGQLYDNDCPEEFEADFLRGYNQGRTQFKLDEISEKLEAQRKESEEEKQSL